MIFDGNCRVILVSFSLDDRLDELILLLQNLFYLAALLCENMIIISQCSIVLFALLISQALLVQGVVA
jgi:hypothetical protein